MVDKMRAVKNTCSAMTGRQTAIFLSPFLSVLFIPSVSAKGEVLFTTSRNSVKSRIRDSVRKEGKEDLLRTRTKGECFAG